MFFDRIFKYSLPATITRNAYAKNSTIAILMFTQFSNISMTFLWISQSSFNNQIKPKYSRIAGKIKTIIISIYHLSSIASAFSFFLFHRKKKSSQMVFVMCRRIISKKKIIIINRIDLINFQLHRYPNRMEKKVIVLTFVVFVKYTLLRWAKVKRSSLVSSIVVPLFVKSVYTSSHLTDRTYR